jgi:hypothetical protein
MLFRMVQITLALAVALTGGAYATWKSIRGTDTFGAVTIGEWISYPDSGTTSADPYAKARLARDASLALGAAEGVTFFADRDGVGDALSGACTYEIAGDSPTARIWTIFAVGKNQTPMTLDDPAWPVSLHSSSIFYQNTGGFRILVSATARPDNWLAVKANDPFVLAFTLYDSPVASNKGLIETAFPTITKVKCDA